MHTERWEGKNAFPYIMYFGKAETEVESFNQLYLDSFYLQNHNHASST